MKKNVKIAKELVKMAKSIVAMANFGKYNGFRFFIWSSDLDENRMHVHAQKDGNIAKFWLEPEIALAEDGHFSERDLNDCKKIVIEHQDEFVKKFKNELKKRNASLKTAFVLDQSIVDVLPVIKYIVNALDNENISSITFDKSRLGAIIEFNEVNGVEPWIEIAYSKSTKKQNVHFEISHLGEKMVEIDQDVENGQEADMAEKIKVLIKQAFDVS